MADGTSAPVEPPVFPAVLYAQHGRIRELMAEVRAAEDASARRARFDELRRLLAAHETAEEFVLRPVSAKVMDRDVTAARNREEHEIVGLMAGLEKARTDREFAERFAPFEQAVAAHLSMEEAEEFPIVEQQVDVHERAVMARWIDRVLEFGPTHAHPAVTGSPVAQHILGPFTALLDRARDRFEGSREHGEAHGRQAHGDEAHGHGTRN